MHRFQWIMQYMFLYHAWAISVGGSDLIKTLIAPFMGLPVLKPPHPHLISGPAMQVKIKHTDSKYAYLFSGHKCIEGTT